MVNVCADRVWLAYATRLITFAASRLGVSGGEGDGAGGGGWEKKKKKKKAGSARWEPRACAAWLLSDAALRLRREIRRKRRRMCLRRGPGADAARLKTFAASRLGESGVEGDGAGA